MSPDLLNTIRAEIVARLEELRPQILEYEQLLSASEALGVARAVSSGASAPAGSAASAPAGPAASAPAAASAPGATPASGRRRASSPRRGSRPRRNEASAAILAALEHGSHTTAELTVVTGLSAPAIRRDLRLLLGEGAISRTTRAGKTAYALPA